MSKAIPPTQTAILLNQSCGPAGSAGSADRSAIRRSAASGSGAGAGPLGRAALPGWALTGTAASTGTDAGRLGTSASPEPAAPGPASATGCAVLAFESAALWGLTGSRRASAADSDRLPSCNFDSSRLSCSSSLRWLLMRPRLTQGRMSVAIKPRTSSRPKISIIQRSEETGGPAA